MKKIIFLIVFVVSSCTEAYSAALEGRASQALFANSLLLVDRAAQMPEPAAPSAIKFGLEAFQDSAIIYARSIGKISVGIDPNRELMYSILHLTSYASKLRNGRVTALAAAVLGDLGQFKEHPAVAELDSNGSLNWTRGLCFDTFSSFPGYFSSLPDSKRIHEYDDEFLGRVLPGLSRAEKVKYLDAYWEKVKDFYKVSGFAGFFRKNEGVYRSYVDSVFERLPGTDVAALHEEYHGYRGFERFYIVPSPLNLPPGGSFGGHIGNSIFNFMGYGYDDAQAVKFLALHEFGHSFCNTTVESHLPELGNYGFLMNGLYEDMKKQGYGSWDTVMYELLVRAVHARLLLKTEGQEAAELFLLREIHEHKFVFIRDFYDLLDVYEKNRDEYPQLKDFYPRLMGALSGWRLAEVKEPEPAGVWTTAVPSGLSIDYAEPSGSAYAAGLRDGDVLRASDGQKPQATFFFTLKAGRTYALSVTHKDGSEETLLLNAGSRTTLRPVNAAGR